MPFSERQSLAHRSPVWCAGLEGLKKKPGAWKNKRACENGTWGGNMRPLPSKKSPGRCASEGPCDPLANKAKQRNKIPKTRLQRYWKRTTLSVTSFFRRKSWLKLAQACASSGSCVKLFSLDCSSKRETPVWRHLLEKTPLWHQVGSPLKFRVGIARLEVLSACHLVPLQKKGKCEDCATGGWCHVCSVSNPCGHIRMAWNSSKAANTGGMVNDVPIAQTQFCVIGILLKRCPKQSKILRRTTANASVNSSKPSGRGQCFWNIPNKNHLSATAPFDISSQTLWSSFFVPFCLLSRSCLGMRDPNPEEWNFKKVCPRNGHCAIHHVEQPNCQDKTIRQKWDKTQT